MTHTPDQSASGDDLKAEEYWRGKLGMAEPKYCANLSYHYFKQGWDAGIAFERSRRELTEDEQRVLEVVEAMGLRMACYEGKLIDIIQRLTSTDGEGG